MGADEYDKLEATICAILTVAAMQKVDAGNAAFSGPAPEALNIYRELIRLTRQTGGVVDNPPRRP
jgi:hypothetical protein